MFKFQFFEIFLAERNGKMPVSSAMVRALQDDEEGSTPPYQPP
jgi:hypothetical protein